MRALIVLTYLGYTDLFTYLISLLYTYVFDNVLWFGLLWYFH